MTIQKLFARLQTSNSKNRHLILGEVFNLAFSRRLRTHEWGFLQKLISLYGKEIVYWSILNSSHIDSTNNPLAYVSKVCIGAVKEELKENRLFVNSPVLNELKNYKQPDWNKELGGEDAPS